jgi:hypothetical protein
VGVRSGTHPRSTGPGRAARALALALATTLPALPGCGYQLASTYRVLGGADHLHVRVFENDSTDPELGATVTAALREELVRRGAWAGPDAPAVLDGWVRTSESAPSTYGATLFGMSVEMHGRLTVQGKIVHEVTVKRYADHLGGADPLETEGRRAVALRKLARDASRELLRAFEQSAPAR